MEISEGKWLLNVLSGNSCKVYYYALVLVPANGDILF
jgi:hypothetical protein